MYLLVIILVWCFRDICGVCCFRYFCDFIFRDLEAQTLKYLFQYFTSYSFHLFLNCILDTLRVFTVPKGVIDIQRQFSVTFFILLLRSSSFLDLTLLDSFSLVASDRLLGASEFTSLSSASFSPRGNRHKHNTSKCRHKVHAISLNILTIWLRLYVAKSKYLTVLSLIFIFFSHNNCRSVGLACLHVFLKSL